MECFHKNLKKKMYRNKETKKNHFLNYRQKKKKKTNTANFGLQLRNKKNKIICHKIL